MLGEFGIGRAENDFLAIRCFANLLSFAGLPTFLQQLLLDGLHDRSVGIGWDECRWRKKKRLERQRRTGFAQPSALSSYNVSPRELNVDHSTPKSNTFILPYQSQ